MMKKLIMSIRYAEIIAIVIPIIRKKVRERNNFVHEIFFATEI